MNSRHVPAAAKLILLAITLTAGSAPLFAKSKPKPLALPTTWWPDPSTGLMWTGDTIGNYPGGLTWDAANTLCPTLQLGGYTDWRLPTLQEAKAVLALYTETFNFTTSFNPHANPYQYKAPTYEFKFDRGIAYPQTVWTATPYQAKYWGVQPWRDFGFLNTKPVTVMGSIRHAAHTHQYRMPIFETSGPTTHFDHLALCVRQMDPDVAAAARLAHPGSPIPDLPTLKAYVPYRHAYSAYARKNYQQSLTDLQAALEIQPMFADAQWALGLVYGVQQQWDQAIASLQAAHKLSNAAYISNALTWAQQEQAHAANPKKKVKWSTPVWSKPA